MHFVCGQTIAQTERGGYIVFDADLLPVGHEDDCSVVIQPKPTYNQVTPGSYVLFYFSGFQIGNNCQDMYVEVKDGTGINIDPIKGIQFYLFRPTHEILVLFTPSLSISLKSFEDYKTFLCSTL